MIEEWREIENFPGYSVSSRGSVRNDKTGRNVRLSVNQNGVCHVGLMQGGRQYKRAMARIVATAFIDRDPDSPFDTPINLDGDRTNNAVENLMWRPRWFAWKYHRQFHENVRLRRPIREITTGEKFADSREAAVEYGILEWDLLLSIMNRTYVFPTYQTFEEVS